MSAPTVIVIGGGFAGLSAATALIERGFQVTVVEGRQVLGGRAYSFVDPRTGDSVDNGQHLFMGCYYETQAFFKRIGAMSKLQFQPSLSVDFVGDRNRSARLRCLPVPSPWHIASGLLRLKTLSWRDRMRLIHVQKALEKAGTQKDELDQITIDEWLNRCHQSETAKRHLWNLIAIAAINEDPRIASAAGFVEVLRRAFFEDWTASRLGLSMVGLSDLYAYDARHYIDRNHGAVHLKSPVHRLEIRQGVVTGVVLREGTRLEADWVVSAVPAPALLRMLPKDLVQSEPVFSRLEQLKTAPIISIHLWFDRPITRKLFVGLLDTQIQWLFNKSKISRRSSSDGYVSLVISGAHDFEQWTDKRLLTMSLEELRRLFPKSRDAVLLRSLVIKEHHATLSPVPGTESLRPETQSPVRNLLLAGDWIRTGLPATIESACVSGHACANHIIQHELNRAPAPPELTHV